MFNYGVQKLSCVSLLNEHLSLLSSVLRPALCGKPRPFQIKALKNPAIYF